MNYEEALEILDFDPHAKITPDDLKKRYHKLALQYHPDKNGGSDDSKQRCQLVNEAYDVVHSHMASPGIDQPSEPHSSPKDYNTLFQAFMDNFARSRDFPEMSVMKEIVLSGCQKLSLTLFENIDKDVALNTLSFLCKYKDILHIDEDTIDAVKHIIAKKYENDMVFVLNPTLDDMLNSNVYKLNVDERTYYVPLWHSEAYFDGPKGEIIVKCIPTLPDNVYVDEFNFIHVELTRKFSVDLFNEPSLSFYLGTHKFEIPRVLFRKTHTYHLENQGLFPINVHDIYNETRRTGLHVKLTFVD